MPKLQYFGHLMRSADSLEKTLMLGKIEGRMRMGRQRTRWLDGITNSMDMSLSWLQGMVKNREAWHAVIHGVAKSSTLLSNWTTTMSLVDRVPENLWTEVWNIVQKAVVHGVAKSLTQVSDWTELNWTLFWRRKWQHTPVLLPGESHGQRNLVGYSPWRRIRMKWLSTSTAQVW